jgi:hypothetical protein
MPEVHTIFEFVRNHADTQWPHTVYGLGWGRCVIEHVVAYDIFFDPGRGPHDALRR